MKKIAVFVALILTLATGTAFAEINKTISGDDISLGNTWRQDIKETNQQIFVTLSRNGYTKTLFGMVRIDTYHYLYISVVSMGQKADNPQNIRFDSKSNPVFVLVTDKGESTYYFHPATSISTESVSYNPDNASLLPLVQAQRVFLDLPQKDGKRYRTEIPPDILKEWRDILTCDLKKELKKGI